MQLSRDVWNSLRDVCNSSRDVSMLSRDVIHFLHNVVIDNFETAYHKHAGYQWNFTRYASLHHETQIEN